MHRLLGVILLLSPIATLCAQPSPPTFVQAVEAYNSGRIPEARRLFEESIRISPDFFRIYDPYWRSVGRMDDAAERKVIIEWNLRYLETVPETKRDEDYYAAVTTGHGILGNREKATSFEDICVARFPAGRLAQQKRLQRADTEKDPLRAAKAYSDYLTAFGENVSWASLAANSRFRLLEQNPQLFSTQDLTAAASEAEQRSLVFFRNFSDPLRHVNAMRGMAEALTKRDPAAALQFAHRGIQFIEEQWPLTNALHEEDRRAFWPVLLQAYLAQSNWKAASKIAETMLRELDGALASGKKEPNFDERKLRLDYAKALDQLQQPEAAQRERRLADTPDRNRGDRMQGIRTQLLASEKKRAAKPFTLQDLSGEKVSLEDYRGRTLILSMWATWCGPCAAELMAFSAEFDRYRADPTVAFLAISVDSDKEAVPVAAKERGYRFPILLSDGSIDEFYQTDAIPKLYVIDGAGQIRFQVDGYLADGDFQQKIAWMLEAARK
ncbi:TlpA family protein disulfide reductase [Bryobacter aggregatus]|uniref:TlpA family protein disulfide reductase n=1 Tax=Bryobacter aggregatus TaxID=360054 RepID=UPI0004E0F257|nr:TlpA disulfide reductase family protein [Bryobacter aggregatus]